MNGGDDSRTVVDQSQTSLPDTLPPFGNGGGKVAVAQHSADPDVHLAKAPRDLLDTRAATGASALQPVAGMPSKQGAPGSNGGDPSEACSIEYYARVISCRLART